MRISEARSIGGAQAGHNALCRKCAFNHILGWSPSEQTNANEPSWSILFSSVGQWFVMINTGWCAVPISRHCTSMISSCHFLSTLYHLCKSYSPTKCFILLSVLLHDNSFHLLSFSKLLVQMFRPFYLFDLLPILKHYSKVQEITRLRFCIGGPRGVRQLKATFFCLLFNESCTRYHMDYWRLMTLAFPLSKRASLD